MLLEKKSICTCSHGLESMQNLLNYFVLILIKKVEFIHHRFSISFCYCVLIVSYVNTKNKSFELPLIVSCRCLQSPRDPSIKFECRGPVPMKGKKEPMITYFLSRTSSGEMKDNENNTKVRVIIRDSKHRIKQRKQSNYIYLIP